MRPPRFPISRELSVILGALLLLLFIGPVATWWARAGMHWTTPFGLWLLVILGGLLIYLRDPDDEP